MIYLFVAIVVLFGDVAIAQTSSVEERRAVGLAQRTAVNRLDRALTSRQPLAVWFRQLVGPETSVQWEVNDCGEATGTSADMGRNLPICVQAIASLTDKREVSISIAVGTEKKGMFRSARFRDAYVNKGNARVELASSLSELAALLRK